jgi:heat shock protein HslJ
MLKKMSMIVTMLVLVSIVLTGCGGMVRPTAESTPLPAVQQPAVQQPAAQQPAAQDLSGTVWKWTTSLFNDDTRKTPDDPNNYLLEFLPQGAVAIKADCNRVAGAYTTNGNQLTITPGPSTMAACPPGSMGDEYVQQLTNVTSYLFKDGNLILEFKFDSGSMTFAPSAPAGLSGTAWTVVNYNNGNQAVVTLIAGSEISLKFGADGQVSGNAGCNQYGGAYQAEGANLKVGPLVNTSMACASPEGVMEQETKYLAALQNAATYVIEGNTLTIRDAGGAMQVVATKAAASSGLGGTSWTVINYNNGNEAVVGMITGSEVTLNFGADGNVNGNAGCNRYSGAYQAENQTLTVGQLVTTMMMCASPEGVMEQETKYLAALQKAATYSIDGNMLTIRDASGATQVIATPAAASSGLGGTSWTVINYNNGNEAVVGMIAGSEVTLNFGTDSQVNGSAGCNRYSGPYQSQDKELKVGQLVTTMMMCASPEGVMEQETKYVAALQNAATYSIDGNMLTIRDAGGATQVIATPAAASSGLGGTAWTVINYNNGNEAVVGMIAGNEVTLNFGTDGQVNGSAGCNRYAGPYQSQDAALKVGPLASTMMACASPEGVMEQETKYLAALQNAATYSIDGNMLTIRDASGATQVIATPATAASGLGGSEWKVVNYNNGKQAVVTLIPGSDISLGFGADGEVVGSGGCNRYFGPYQSQDAMLQVGPLASTRMACEAPEGVMEQETQYLIALQEAATYTIDGNTLTIRDEGGAMQVVATR